jgi:agmatinase
MKTTIFYDIEMRRDPRWIDAVVASLQPDVYVSIDVDGLDPAIMPATGTPEPGGLSWPEVTALLRAVAEGRRIVACDVVELSPIPGMVAPNFLCAKLVYKLLTYRFAGDPRAKRI